VSETKKKEEGREEEERERERELASSPSERNHQSRYPFPLLGPVERILTVLLPRRIL